MGASEPWSAQREGPVSWAWLWPAARCRGGQVAKRQHLPPWEACEAVPQGVVAMVIVWRPLLAVQRSRSCGNALPHGRVFRNRMMRFTLCVVLCYFAAVTSFIPGKPWPSVLWQCSQMLLRRYAWKGITIRFKEISSIKSAYYICVWHFFALSEWPRVLTKPLYPFPHYLCKADNKNCFVSNFISIKLFEIPRWKAQGASSCQREICQDLPEQCPVKIQAIKIIDEILLLIISSDSTFLTLATCND